MSEEKQSEENPLEELEAAEKAREDRKRSAKSQRTGNPVLFDPWADVDEEGRATKPD